MSNPYAVIEQEILQKMDIPDFRHMTKDKIVTFASMLNDMEPEVAKKALEQFPDFAKMALEILEDYNEIMEKTLDLNSLSSKQCFDIYNEVVGALKSCLTKDDLPFEEKKYYIEKMMEIADMADNKDNENKEFNWKIISLGTFAVFSVVGIAASVLGGNANIKLPKLKW